MCVCMLDLGVFRLDVGVFMLDLGVFRYTAIRSKTPPPSYFGGICGFKGGFLLASGNFPKSWDLRGRGVLLARNKMVVGKFPGALRAPF